MGTIAAAAALLLGGCKEGKPAGQAEGPAAAPTSAEAKKLTIEFWHYFGGDHEKALKQLIADFEKQNPGIAIRGLFQGRPQELLQKLQGSFATKPSNNPALATVYESWTTDFHQKGLMDPVQNHFDGPDGLAKAEQDDIVQTFRAANTYDGKMVTMPFNKSVYCLYVNLDRLEKAGLTTAPKTLDEFRDAILKLSEREGDRVKTYGLGMQPASEAFTALFFAGGGDFMAEGRLRFDTPLGVEVMNFWRNLQFPTKNLYVSTEYMDAPFGNQQIAMFIYSSASFPYNAKSVAGRFKWTVAPIPGNGGENARYVMQGTNVGIFANKSPEERAAAWKFLKFVTSTDSAAFWETKTGYMPIRYSVLKTAAMQEYMAKNPAYAEASSWVLSNRGRQEPQLREWDGIRQEIGVMVDRVLNKGEDPAKELPALQQRVDQRLSQIAKTGGAATSAAAAPETTASKP
jgi:multiple sugar transport system substrate-binding protein